MEEKETSSSLCGKPDKSKNIIIRLAQVVVANKTFDWIITAVILLQAVVLALEATPEMHSFGRGRVTRSNDIQLSSRSSCYSFHHRGYVEVNCSISKAATVFQRRLELL
jgi:hypothetical protein